MKSVSEFLLSVHEIVVHAHIGWYEEERKKGGKFQVDVDLIINRKNYSDLSEIDSTVNYEQIMNSVIQTIDNPYRLIEEAGLAVYEKLFEDLKDTEIVQSLSVQLTKLNPPIKYVGKTSVMFSSD